MTNDVTVKYHANNTRRMTQLSQKEKRMFVAGATYGLIQAMKQEGLMSKTMDEASVLNIVLTRAKHKPLTDREIDQLNTHIIYMTTVAGGALKEMKASV